MDRREEVLEKHARLNAFLEDHNLEGVFLTSVPNFAWFSAGGDSHVENHSKFGVASFLVTKSKRFLLTNNIEVERILTEQLRGVEDLFQPITYDWYDSQGELKAMRSIAEHLVIACDQYRDTFRLLPAGFNRLRYPLTVGEVARSKWLGKNTAEAVEDAARAVEPGMTEFEIEAIMAAEITRRGIQPVVLLVAGDARNAHYRHPVPTETVFNRFAKLVCCARKWGLITALTRCVHAGQLPPTLADKQRAVALVDSVYMDATRPGKAVRTIINAGKTAYEQAGFPDEWRQHHQGGAIGYEAREYLGTSDSNETVLNSQTFAWNPSIEGNKSEDTILVNELGIEVITETGDWPQLTLEVHGNAYRRPDILEI